MRLRSLERGMIHLFLKIRPFAKQRPRFTGKHAYMDSGYMKRKRELLRQARQQYNGPMLTGRLKLTVNFYTRSGGMAPDHDNAIGAILDALQGDKGEGNWSQGLILNDKQVKEWGPGGVWPNKEPRIEVRIEEV